VSPRAYACGTVLKILGASALAGDRIPRDIDINEGLLERDLPDTIYLLKWQTHESGQSCPIRFTATSGCTSNFSISYGE
jgi:hypothetical protein